MRAAMSDGESVDPLKNDLHENDSAVVVDEVQRGLNMRSYIFRATGEKRKTLALTNPPNELPSIASKLNIGPPTSRQSLLALVDPSLIMLNCVFAEKIRIVTSNGPCTTPCCCRLH